MSLAEGPDPAYFALAPGAEWVMVDHTTAVLRAAQRKATIEGRGVGSFLSDVLPLIDGTNSIEAIARASTSVPLDDLRSYLRQLVAAGLLVESRLPEGPLRPMVEVLSFEGRPPESVERRLSSQVVAIFGLQSVGAALTVELARSGAKELILVDPSSPRADDPSRLQGQGAETRQEALARLGREAFPHVAFSAPLTDWTQERVADVADRADILVATLDRDRAAVAHWVNKAALAKGKVAAFATIDGETCLIGPIVYPDETACYMCYRMRTIACEEDYGAAMAFEELRDRSRVQSDRREPTFLPAVAVAAGILAGEIAKTVTATGRHALASRVIEWNGLEASFSEHDVLRQPTCPACSKKKLLNPEFPPFDLLPTAPLGSGLKALEARLVSPRTGIIRSLSRFRKGPREPERPYIVRAELANFRYLRDKGEAFQVASGKGMDEDRARVSALGEAVERYSGGIWPAENVPCARRAELDSESMDPRDLVLYPAQAYASLPYQPYEEGSVLGWLWGRDLVSGIRLAIPAQPTLMSYAPGPEETALCQVTSNGLAAGPSLAEATLRAAYEVIERDAFVATWLLRLPCHQVEVASLGQPDLNGLASAYLRRGVKLELYRMPSTTNVHCFMCLGIAESSDAAPAVTVGLGADHDPLRAGRSALLEVAQVRPGLKYRLNDDATLAHREALLADPTQVRTLEDHDLYYSGVDKLPCFDFLRKGETAVLGDLKVFDGTPEVRLRHLLDDLSGAGHHLYAVDLSPPDLVPLGLFTARVWIGNYQPIYFGQNEMRLSMQRLSWLSASILKVPFDPANLNPEPHPLA